MTPLLRRDPVINNQLWSISVTKHVLSHSANIIDGLFLSEFEREELNLIWFLLAIYAYELNTLPASYGEVYGLSNCLDFAHVVYGCVKLTNLNQSVVSDSQKLKDVAATTK